MGVMDGSSGEDWKDVTKITKKLKQKVTKKYINITSTELTVNENITIIIN